MKKGTYKYLTAAICMLTAFLLWTAMVRYADVQNIGPQDSSVGFATANRFIHNFIGVNMALYTVTDWLGLVPLMFMMGFAILGLTQWIKRKHILKVDYSILVLGVFYTAVISVYLLFETFVVNYRPVLINGYLEASYPSSTTMLVMCVMPTAAMQLNSRIKSKGIKRCISAAITVFTVFMVAGRFVSGVHWFSDIMGSIFLSLGLVLLYRAVTGLSNK